jgi:hypothetical protein
MSIANKKSSLAKNQRWKISWHCLFKCYRTEPDIGTSISDWRGWCSTLCQKSCDRYLTF